MRMRWEFLYLGGWSRSGDFYCLDYSVHHWPGYVRRSISQQHVYPYWWLRDGIILCFHWSDDSPWLRTVNISVGRRWWTPELCTRIFPHFPIFFRILPSNYPHRQWSRYRGIEFWLTHKDDMRPICSIEYSPGTRTTAYLVYHSFPLHCTTFLIDSLFNDAILTWHRHPIQSR